MLVGIVVTSVAAQTFYRLCWVARDAAPSLSRDCCLDAPGQTHPEYAPTDPRRTASPRRAPRGMEWERYGAVSYICFVRSYLTSRLTS